MEGNIEQLACHMPSRYCWELQLRRCPCNCLTAEHFHAELPTGNSAPDLSLTLNTKISGWLLMLCVIHDDSVTCTNSRLGDPEASMRRTTAWHLKRWPRLTMPSFSARSRANHGLSGIVEPRNCATWILPLNSCRALPISPRKLWGWWGHVTITWQLSQEMNDFNFNCSPAGSFLFLVRSLAAKKCSSQSG